MEIIQLVAINVHDKAQHIVDQSRKPCAFIPQQVEDFIEEEVTPILEANADLIDKSEVDLKV